MLVFGNSCRCSSHPRLHWIPSGSEQTPASFFSGPSRAAVTPFLAVWNRVIRPSATSQACVGALRGHHPAGEGSGEPGGVEAREGRHAPLPADRRERLAAELCGLEGGLSRKGDAVLFECLFYGAINIGVLISLGVVDEGES